MTREEAGRWVQLYLDNGFAVTWTDGKKGDAAKRVSRSGWNETQPLQGEIGVLAGQFAQRIQLANPAVVTATSGLVSIDCDDEDGLQRWQGYGAPETFTVRSSSPHKRHFHYRRPEGFPYSFIEFGAGEITAKSNQYLLLPPALHPSGVVYESLNGSRAAELPAEICKRLAEDAEALKRRESRERQEDPQHRIREPGRRDVLFRYACMQRRWTANRDVIAAAVHAFNEAHCEPPVQRRYVEQQIDGAMKMPGGEETEPVSEWDGDLAALLEKVRRSIRRFIVVGEAESYALALWVAHTHVFDAAEVTPYIELRSAEKRCGKTTLLRVVASLVARPRMSADMSDAVLYRLVAQETPTLLWDEVDAIFGQKAKDREDTRKLLNAGFESGATAWRMGGANNTVIEEFPVFCPKAFASIGKLPDTLTDRSITIHMLRKHRGEKVERARRRAVSKAGESLRAELAGWGSSAVGALAKAEPELPEQLNDREQDCWEPLFAIADLAGEHWAKAGRKAALELSALAAEDMGLTEELLAGIYRAFERVQGAHLSTVDLITSLCVTNEEGVWREWWWDERESRPTRDAPRRLATKLRPLGIRSTKVRTSEGSLRGYTAEQFSDSWARYEICGTSGSSGTTRTSKQADVPDVPHVPHKSGTQLDFETAPMDLLREHSEEADG